MRPVIMIIAAAIILAVCAVVGIIVWEATHQEMTVDKERMNEWPMEQLGMTESIPGAYLQPVEGGRTVERLDYPSKDYTDNNRDITKTAYVYLPPGYDSNDTGKRYDIFYFMHGWTGTSDEFFSIGRGMNVNLLDNLIVAGDIPPIIAVAATFDAENESQNFSRSVTELRQFHQDFLNHLMPAVEGKYHTYAESVSKEDLMASRDHRAFGGFSLGSVTTWMQFCYNYDYIRYYLPMSGACWYYGGYGDYYPEETCDFFEELIGANNLNERGYFIYSCTGTNDAVRNQVDILMDSMLHRSDVFTPDHLVYYMKEGGVHDFNAVMEYIYNALPIFFGQKSITHEPQHFTTSTRIADVMADPVFGDHGRLMFPVESGYCSGSTIGNLRLTWYNHIDPKKSTEVLNDLWSRASDGETIFFDIYSDEEKRVDPDKEDTGLFFFKGDPGAKFAICNAGGGFSYVGAIHDSFPHALELSKKGYNAFALIYRPGAQTACEDLSRAISFVFEHADELQVDVRDYSLWGGSAGARMANWVGTYGTAYFGEADLPRPSMICMQYTGLSEVTGYEPPTYSCVGTSDGIANYRMMENRITAIQKNGTDAMIEVFSGLPHGFGLGAETSAEGWIFNAIGFWESQMA